MDYEKLGVFYLGREVDPETFEQAEAPLLYDSNDLTTHAVIIGMTGSGKTGLGIGLIEEAAIDGIPVLAIDPKGDLGNLALTFPDLAPADFEPWVDAREAERKEMSVSEYAAREANKWANGLKEWDQDGARIKRLRDAAEVVVYTPGSAAGRPISVLRSFAAPAQAVMDDSDLLAERLTTTVTGLLTLLGTKADPLSREAILLSSILEHAWRAGKDMGLAELIQAVQAPPFKQLGVMDLEAVFPSSDRLKLALTLNSLVASPTFEAWTKGEPLDIGSLLYAPDGRARVAVVSIAHLSDAEREFFMSLLLSELVSYTRAQSGTSSLRALVYIDELFGFLPPVAEPATKKPLMTLLKQARAFGVGLALATQNPVDLDYKALTNAGTWFIGRLQTERDKARLIDGLTTAAPGGLSSSRLGDLISSLSMRTFLLHNVHASGPLLFQTRWVMSYMAGPLTREQIRRLSEESRVAAPPTAEPVAETSGVSVPAAADTSPAVSDRPFVRPEVPERFLRPVRGASDPSYFPLVLGAADVHYASKAYGVDLTRRITLTTELSEGLISLDWNEGDAVDVPLEALEEDPLDGVSFRPLPDVALDAKAVKSWTDLFQRWLRVEGALSLMRHAGLKLVSEPGENERDFRVRCAQLLREQRDTAREKLRQKYTSKLTTLERRRLQRQQAVERTSQQAQQRSLDAAVTIGGTLLDAFLRRKAPSSTSIGTAVRRTTGIDKQRGDVARAKEALDQTAEEIATLQAELEAELDALAESRINADELELETVSVKPTSRDVVVRYVGLVWAPFEADNTGRWMEVWG